MRANYVQYSSPQFRLLSDEQIKELHFATLQILERTGVAFECQEAIEILGDAGADVSNPDRVKIPSHLVEQALRTAPKTITLYTREGELAMVLNGQTGCHFGAQPDGYEYLDPYLRKPRQCYVQDVADAVRVVDALPNVEWVMMSGAHTTVPPSIADLVSTLQAMLNTSKPVCLPSFNDLQNTKEMFKLCSIVAGGEEQLRRKPFLVSSAEPVSPLVHGKGPSELSLFCAEKGIPNIVYGMPMAGTTAPATWAGCLAIANAEVLSQWVVLQLRYPGAPLIFGSLPGIMDMKTTIFADGAPEVSLLVAALTELGHYYKVPVFGTGGMTDAYIIGAQAAAEVTYSILVSKLSGADLVHDIGITYHDTCVSPELMVLANEIIDMVDVLMGGIEINNETLPLDLIERLGPRSNYLTEAHTRKHFRRFWAPALFDRSFARKEGVKDCEDLVNEKTIEIIETHQPKSLPEDVVKELREAEKTWFEREGLKREYPKRAQRKQ